MRVAQCTGTFGLTLITTETLIGSATCALLVSWSLRRRLWLTWAEGNEGGLKRILLELCNVPTKASRRLSARVKNVRSCRRR